MNSLPVFLYDGRCGFCRMWLEYLEALVDGKCEWLASQEAGTRFPQIPPEQLRHAAAYVETNGAAVYGAAAIFSVLALAPGRGWLRPGATLRAIGRFVADLVISSLQVAWQSLQAVRPGPPIRSSVVAVRLDSSSEFVMAMITETLCLVPGSVVIEARPEERTIYAHVLGVDDAAGVERFRAQVGRLESDLVDALGRPQAPREAS